MNGNISDLLGGPFIAGETKPKVEVLLSPEKVFENSISEETLIRAKELAFDYEALYGRFDPFDLNMLRASVGTFSVLIKKTVITYQDACDHAVALTGLWCEEDKERLVLSEPKAKARQIENETNILVPGTKDYEVEQARIKWKEAVKQRDEIVANWNEYVAACRANYRQLKGK